LWLTGGRIGGRVRKDFTPLRELAENREQDPRGPGEGRVCGIIVGDFLWQLVGVIRGPVGWLGVMIRAGVADSLRG